MEENFRDDEFANITERDFAIATWQGLAYNGALLRTILQNQMEIMKALKLVEDGVAEEMNETIWEHYQSMNKIMNKLNPLNTELKYRLPNH